MPSPTIDTIPDREQQLDELLASYLQAVKSGRAPSRQKLLESHPELAEELADFFADQDRFDSMAAPLRSVMPSAPAADRAGQTVGNYEVLEEIAQGGMGVVYRARQKRAGRVVALKMVRSGARATEEDLGRFRTEIEAVARLDHAGIVPIYEIGEQEGQPYFSMKLLEGGSLAHLLKAKWPLEARGTPRRAAGLVAAIAHAVHHAHQRGILHRDLKPANILLDGQGRPHVGDFGLAKRVEGDSLKTDTGAILGTPAYMAPEQARGSKGGVTTAADVYSLGAVLFELLVGRPPFKGASPLETLHLALDTPVPRPRALRPGLPRDLEAVCLKCLEKDPHNRYPSALALAEDLQRFLAGEPTHARPAGPAGRLWRWCRRRPLVAGLAAALFLSLTAGLAVVLWQGQQLKVEYNQSQGHLQLAQQNFATSESNRKLAEENFDKSEKNRKLAEENFNKSEKNRLLALSNAEDARNQSKRAEANLVEAEKQRKLADKSFRLAHQAVNDFYTKVDSALVQAPGLQPLRRSLLKTSLDYYREFVKEHGSDPTLRSDLAEAYHRLGWLTSEVGSKAEGLAALEKALNLYRELHAADSKNPDLQRNLANEYHNVALHQNDLNQTGPALANYEQARALYEQILSDRPDDGATRSLLASTVNNLAGMEKRAGHNDEAAALYRRAHELRERLVQDDPSNPNYQANLGHSFHNLGVQSESKGQPREALDYFQKALAIRERLARDYPHVIQGQSDLASSYHSVGMTLRSLGQKDEGTTALDKALEIREKLVRDNPKVISYQVQLASSYTSRAVVHGGDGKNDKALEAHEKAGAILAETVKADPTSATLQRDLAKSHFNRGVQLAQLGRREQAVEAYREALPMQEKLVAADPDHLEYHVDASATFNNLGVVLSRLGQHDDARANLRRSVEEQRFALERAPKSESYRRGLGTRYAGLWDVERAAGRWADAAVAARERRKLWPDSPREAFWLGKELALLAADAEKHSAPAEEVRRYADEALASLRDAVAAGYRAGSPLEDDADLAILRGRADFKTLVENLPK